MHNFSPLNEPLTSEDLAAYKLAFPNDKHHVGDDISIFIILQIVIFNGLLLSIGLVFEFSFGWGGVLNIFAASILVPLVVLVFLAFERRSNNKKRAKLYKFALANHTKLVQDKSADSHSGLIFGSKGESTLLKTLQFPEGMEIGVIQNDGSNGKFGLSGTYTYAVVSLSRHVPNMVLDSRSNNLMSGSSLPDTFLKSQRLSLEGNFNEYFSLYVPKQYETDALYIFTPDVMDALIKTGGKYDIEVVDNKLYLYSKRRVDLSSETELREIVSILTILHGELDKQTLQYKDARQQSELSATHAIAPAGRRLTPGISIFVVVCSIGFLVAHIFSIGGDGSSLIERVLFIIAFGWVISIVVGVAINTFRR